MTHKIVNFIYIIISLFVFTTNSLSCQALNYRQGELIVQLRPNVNLLQPGLSTLKQISKARPFEWKLLSQDWMIYLLKFDFAKYDEQKLLYELKKEDAVLAVQRNRILDYRRKPNDLRFYEQWYHLNDGTIGGITNADFNTDQAWDLSTGGVTENGDSIVICIIDDGIDTNHLEFNKVLWRNYKEIPFNHIDDDNNGFIDDFRGWNSYKNNGQIDQGNHGTPVCGLACAEGNNLIGISGINWNSKLMFIEGGGDEANAILSYNYPWKMRKAYNESDGKEGAFVVVTSTSWGIDYGRPEDAPIWCAVYDSLGKVGILNVCATTNANINVDVEGDLPTACPSNYLIGVTNMNWNDEKELNAGYGKKSIDIAAYGENVLSTAAGNSYLVFGGTSAATPLVAGAVGLFYSVPCSYFDEMALTNPSKAALEMKDILLRHVRKKNSLFQLCSTEGVMDIFRSCLAIDILKINEIGSSYIELQFENTNLIFPIDLEWRKIKSQDWNSIQVSNNEALKINNLEFCTEYEFRYKSGCSRFETSYSEIKIIKTKSCCTSPTILQIDQNNPNQLIIHIQNNELKNKIGVIIQNLDDLTIDTFDYFIENEKIYINHLEACTVYQLKCFSYCEQNNISILSDSVIIKTNQCGNCTAQNYCKRLTSKSNLEWIESISFDGQKFISGNNLGYGNFISSPPIFIFYPNKSYTFVVTPGFFSDSSNLLLSAWIDFNQDGDFEPTENIAGSGIKFKRLFSKQIIIPREAKSGITRMRVALKYAETSDTPPLACNNGLEFGEFEDYCVYIYDNECSRNGNLSISNIAATSCDVYNKDEIEIKFRLHKLHQSNFIQGITKEKTIQLQELDSCTTYELYYKPTCQLESGETKLTFNTSGTSCQLSKTQSEKAEGLVIFPNPFKQHFKISSEQSYEILGIYNSAGINIANKIIFSTNEIVLQDPGVYYIVIKTRDGKIHINKLINI